MAYGELGPTHHSIEDLAWLRAIANMTVIVPADPIETAQAVRVAASAGPDVSAHQPPACARRAPADYRFEIGKAALLRDGDDVTLIANGTMVSRALDAADLLGRRDPGAGAQHGNVRPLDRRLS